MVKHRELSFDDYVAIVRRRRWLIVIPTILGVAAGYLLCLVLPPRYTSHTAVFVEQPTKPDKYVKPGGSGEKRKQRLASMQEQNLSRTRPEHPAGQLCPYKKDSQRA